MANERRPASSHARRSADGDGENGILDVDSLVAEFASALRDLAAVAPDAVQHVQGQALGTIAELRRLLDQ